MTKKHPTLIWWCQPLTLPNMPSLLTCWLLLINQSSSPVTLVLVRALWSLTNFKKWKIKVELYQSTLTCQLRLHLWEHKYPSRKSLKRNQRRSLVHQSDKSLLSLWMISICQLLKSMELNLQLNFLDCSLIEKDFTKEVNGSGKKLLTLLWSLVLLHHLVVEQYWLLGSVEDLIFSVCQKHLNPH